MSANLNILKSFVNEYKETYIVHEVIYEEGCKTGCHGCADLCTEKAISYFGE